jgi:hypothetical protein
VRDLGYVTSYPPTTRHRDRITSVLYSVRAKTSAGSSVPNMSKQPMIWSSQRRTGVDAYRPGHHMTAWSQKGAENQTEPPDLCRNEIATDSASLGATHSTCDQRPRGARPDAHLPSRQYLRESSRRQCSLDADCGSSESTHGLSNLMALEVWKMTRRISVRSERHPVIHFRQFTAELNCLVK